MPVIDLVRIKVAAGTGDLPSVLRDELNKCTPDDPPFMSDLIIKENDGGLFVKMALEERFNKDRSRPEHMRFRWKLHARRDEWGNVPQPGDIVVKRQNRSMKVAPGKFVTSTELTQDRRSGQYDEKWIDKIEYIVDEKGCITCEFHDTAYFLMQFGIHAKSNMPISRHAKQSLAEFEKYEARPELGSRPVDAPDGNKLHPWYWRYAEMDKEDYEKLPIMKKVDKPKRGAVANV